MEVEKILAIQPYKRESGQQKKEYLFNKDGAKRFVSYLDHVEPELAATRADILCFQVGDSIMMQYDKMQSINLRIRMKLESEE